MSDDAMGDEVYQPDQQDAEDAARGPDPENTLGQADPDQLLDAGYSPADEPYAAGEGVTAREQRRGESLDERLAEEEPDTGAGGAAPRQAGPDDVTPAPAEEDAVRVRDDTRTDRG
ncbi:hypothetical protein ADL22_23530 [Streptomyces sp. NRRL F-4489]|uniref:hypothetical protein n=1 Tax=Streptomyces sp. NRRL F-4489 TaxID=1609095 RepID=UPI00074AD54C|nr:hypothetical protein [Streptomyces sp. NRRL F-4489]KUL36870.1 hypothetical protein ADL22_23530 [Streptomyces sp. NRRL F-4489]